MLRSKTFKRFKLTRDPFAGDVARADDVYLTDDTRFAAEWSLPDYVNIVKRPYPN